MKIFAFIKIRSTDKKNIDIDISYDEPTFTAFTRSQLYDSTGIF